jgi:two-component system response regulator
MTVEERKVVLLVEDNPDDRELALRAFERHELDADLEVMDDGQAALDYLLSPGPGGELRPLPRLVLLDLKLPKVDGLEVLRRLRADPRTRLLPVVMLTSSAEEQDLVRSYSLGANSYVRKPVSFTEFVEAARELGLYWLVLNRPAPGEP